MVFKNFKMEDCAFLNSYLMRENENSCEYSFVNLLCWAPLYKMMYAVEDDILYIKSEYNGEDVFYLPLGDTKKGIEALKKYSKKELPPIWAQSGPLFESFKSLYGELYDITESTDEADYIYSRKNLAELSGKKYHSKRNHISAFSKKYDWEYERISSENLEEIKLCAKEWYAENLERMDREMQAEQGYLFGILENADKISAFGGAIRANGKIVAFTLASKINEKTVDIHIEKALSDYSEAYSVINREFAARELKSYEYINREDDMGLSGLRAAKLSYHPEYLLKKYICTDKKTADIKRIYHEAFGEDENFDGVFFANFLNCARVLEKDGRVVSVLFKIPCEINGKRVYYIYAAATEKKNRNKGYMSELLKKTVCESDCPLFLKPEREDLISFYEKCGFFAAQVKAQGEIPIKAGEKQKRLSALADNRVGEFTLMFSKKEYSGKTYRFYETME